MIVLGLVLQPPPPPKGYIQFLGSRSPENDVLHVFLAGDIVVFMFGCYLSRH